MISYCGLNIYLSPYLSSQKHMFLRVIVLINILWFQRNVLVLYKGETLLPHSQLYIILVNGFFLGTFQYPKVQDLNQATTNSRLRSHYQETEGGPSFCCHILICHNGLPLQQQLWKQEFYSPMLFSTSCSHSA